MALVIKIIYKYNIPTILIYIFDNIMNYLKGLWKIKSHNDNKIYNYIKSVLKILKNS